MTTLEALFERINGDVSLAAVPNVDAVGEFKFERCSWREVRVGSMERVKSSVFMSDLEVKVDLGSDEDVTHSHARAGAPVFISNP
jgi:hypothetical protein